MSTWPTLSPTDAERYYRARLPGLHRQGDGVHLRAACPIHRGDRDSLSVHTETWQWRCHAACNRGGYVWELEAALAGVPEEQARALVYQVLGQAPPTLDPLPPAPPPGPEKLERSHCYFDAAGSLLFEVQVYRRPDGTKRVTQRRPDPEAPGRWLWKLGDVARPLYRLPQLRAADPTATVWVVEGERKVEYLERLGFVATCNPGGAKKWRAEHTAELRGRHVLIVPDRNAPGREHAQLVARALTGVAASVRLAEPPVAEGLDIGDWLKAGATRLHVEDFARGAAPWHAPAPTAPPPGEPPASGLDWVPPSDEGKPPQAQYTEAFAREHSGRFCYEAETKRWFGYEEYAPGVWSEIPAEVVAAAIAAPLDERRLSYTASYIRSILYLLSLRLQAGPWDPDPHLVGCQNGVLDLRTKQLLPHAPERRLTAALDFPFDPQATPGPILPFLEDISQGQVETLAVLRAWLRAVATRRHDIQRFVELLGAGGAGKGTFQRLCMRLVGLRNCHTTTLKQLEENRFETAALRGKALVVITDSERFGGEVSILKAITGGDTVREERKGVQQLPGFKPRCLVVIACNEAIQAADYTSGLSRRRITIPFKRATPTHQQRDLDSEFGPHLPGLLTWCLAMPEDEMLLYLRHTESLAPAIAEARMEVMTDTDSLAAWAEHALVYDRHAKTKIGDAAENREHRQPELYHSYVKFCQDRGFRPRQANRFASNLVDFCTNTLHLAGVQRKRTKAGYVVEGLRLRDVGEDAEPFIAAAMGAARVNLVNLGEPEKHQVHPPETNAQSENPGAGEPGEPDLKSPHMGAHDPRVHDVRAHDTRPCDPNETGSPGSPEPESESGGELHGVNLEDEGSPRFTQVHPDDDPLDDGEPF